MFALRRRVPYVRAVLAPGSALIALMGTMWLLERSLDTHAVIDRQPMQPGDVPITFADITKARKLLGYNPTTKIADGIPKFVEWFRNVRQH